MKYQLPGLFSLLLLLTVQSPQDLQRRHFETAEAQRRAGNFAAAEAEYTTILAEGYGKLGKIYAAQKDYSKAIPALEYADRCRPGAPDVLLDLAIARFDAEQYEKTLEPLRKIIARDPQNPGARQMLGKAYFMLGDFDKSAAELEVARKLAPGDYEVAYTLGLANLKQQRLAPAKQIYDRMVEQLGDRPQLRIVLGRAYRETGFLPQAIEEFQKAVALDPKFPRAHYYLGLTYLLKDGAPRLDDAAAEFKVELASNPDEFFANYYLGVVYIIQRNWELSTSFLEKASRLQPDNPDPYFYLGQAYQELRKHDRAIEVLRRSIALNPDLSHNDYQVTNAHYRLGQLLLKTGQKEEGEKELEITARLKSQGHKLDEEKTANYLNPGLHEQDGKVPEMGSVEGVIAESNKPDAKTLADLKTAEAYYSKVIASAHQAIGLLRADQQDFRQAAEHFALAAKCNPQLERVYYNWGLAAYKAGQFKDAIPPLEKELAASPTSIPSKQLLGMSYFVTQDYSKAAGLLREVVASRPADSGLYYPLAVSLVKQGQNAEALQVIEKMIAVGGNTPQVHILLGQAYQEQGDSTKALEELRTASGLDSKVPLAHYYSGLIYIKLGKLDDAARELLAEMAISPGDVEVKYHLAFVLLANQDTQRGIAMMREVTQARPDYGEARYELGKALLQKGDTKEAIENLEIAARIKPDEPYVHYQLGRAYLAADRKTDGENQLDIFKQLKDKARNEPHR
jgi:tetratricopeptide (TPR) repeat protein